MSGRRHRSRGRHSFQNHRKHTMFILRMAEALVTSQELWLNASLSSRPQTGEATANGLVLNGTTQTHPKPACPNQADDATLQEPMPEDSEQLSRNKLSCSTAEGSAPSPNSATTISVRTISPNSVGTSPQLPLSSPTLTNFHDSPIQLKTEGLLYSLLVNSESTSNQSTRSPISCTSPLLTTPVWNNSPPRTPSGSKGTSESSDSMAEHPHLPVNEVKEPRCTQRPTSLVTWPQQASASPDPIVLNNGQNHPHSEESNVLGAIGCNPNRRGARSHTRPHAASMSASSDSHLALRTRLQHRRQPDGPLCDVLHHKAKMSTRNRSISKSQEHPLGFSMSTNRDSVRVHAETESRTSCQHSSTVLSSPRATHHTQSAQARLTNTSESSVPVLPQSQRSSGYCSATSQISSSLSTDSGLDKPVDLTRLQAPTPSHMEQDDSSIQVSCRPLVSRQLVQLAKKTASPVQARVTEWLRQGAEFVATSAPVIYRMKEEYFMRCITGADAATNSRLPLHSSLDSYGMESWVSLLAGCWHRLLALSMVEHALDLVVVEDNSTYPVNQIMQSDRGADQMGLPWLLFAETMNADPTTRPDRQFANGLTQFMSEIRQATLSAQEFYLLRHVILLTTDEPETIPTIGLNVIRASRHAAQPTETEQGFGVAPNTDSPCQSRLPSVSAAESTTDRSNSATALTFDLACLVSGLKALSDLCPYKVANLFCAHLRHGSNLNRQFLSELHNRYVGGILQLDAVHV